MPGGVAGDVEAITSAPLCRFGNGRGADESGIPSGSAVSRISWDLC
jgi:hypothetical protein